MATRSLDEDAGKTFFSHIKELWIARELIRRTEAGHPVTENIDRCLILLPDGIPPIVQFNKEAIVRAVARQSPGTSFVKDQLIMIHELRSVEHVIPPEYEGKRVPFVLLFIVGDHWRIFFDFSPGSEGDVPPKDYRSWHLGKEIAKAYQDKMELTVLTMSSKAPKLLESIGLWSIPCLLPYPMSRILEQLSREDRDGARSTLISYCDARFIQTLPAKWFEQEQFDVRKAPISQAIESFIAGKYESCIYTMFPQIEGIITDWLFSAVPDKESIPWRQESKTAKFNDIVKANAAGSFVHETVAASTTGFLLAGPALKTFKDWLEKLEPQFPNRHAVEHGRYDASLFTQENALKLILLLETLYFIIRKRS